LFKLRRIYEKVGLKYTIFIIYGILLVGMIVSTSLISSFYVRKNIKKDIYDNYINDNYINDNDVNNSNSFITESEESQYFANSVDVEEAIQMIQREANIIIKEAEDEAQRILEESKEDAQKSKIEIEKYKSKLTT
jgi:hypothetical protein